MPAPDSPTRSASLETQLVVALSRLPAEESALARAKQCIAEGVDWNSVMEQTLRWQVEPVVLGNLLAHFADSIPGEVHGTIAQREQLSRAEAVTQTLRVVDVVNGLKNAGVSTLVLKGPAIAKIAYDDISRRTFSDIDLLVAKNDLSEAQRHLATRGYNPLFTSESRRNLIEGGHALEFSGAGPHIELHCLLLPRYFRFDLGPQALWDESVEIEIGPGKARSLSVHHLFVYLCAHGAKHEWMMYRWVCDVAQIAKRLVPEQVQQILSLAEQTGSKRIVALAMRLVRDVFEDDPAPQLSAPLSSEDTDELALVAYDRFGFSQTEPHSMLPRRLAGIHPYAEPLAFWIRSRERLSDQLISAGRFVFEPAAGDKPSGRLAPLMRPLRLAFNAMRRATRRF